MAQGIFEQLAWLTEKVKRLCCAIEQVLPSQSGNAGKYLKTNGTTASWQTIPNELPTQVAGDAGEFLQANGSGGVSYQPALPYKVYSAVLTQSGTNAPTEMYVLQNTIGTVTWTYDGLGQYQTNVLGPYGKVFAICGGASNNPSRVAIFPDFFGRVKIVTSATSISNNILNYTPVEIRVYN